MNIEEPAILAKSRRLTSFQAKHKGHAMTYEIGGRTTVSRETKTIIAADLRKRITLYCCGEMIRED